MMLAGEYSAATAMADGLLNVLVARDGMHAGAGARHELERLKEERDRQQRKKHRAQERAAQLEAQVLELQRRLEAVERGDGPRPVTDEARS
jgi:hypothetical protein